MDKNLAKKIAATSWQISGVLKTMEIPTVRGASYKAVREADVLKAVREAEKDNGLMSMCVSTEVLESREYVYAKNGYELKQLYMVVRCTLLVFDVDTGESIEVSAVGSGMDGSDKASGKAQTYANKYALLKLYKIPTGDDPDEFVSFDNEPKPIVSPKTLEEYRNLNMNESKVTKYIGKPLDEFSEEDFRAVIEMQKAALARKGAQDA